MKITAEGKVRSPPTEQRRRFFLTHFWGGRAPTRGHRSAPSPAEMCASGSSLRAEGLNCESSSSLSSPSAEFSGKHLTPARFPQPCLLLLTVRRGRGGITGTKVAVSQLRPSKRKSRLSSFPRQVSVTRTGNFSISASIPARFLSWLTEIAWKRRSKGCFLGLKQTAGQTTLFRLSRSWWKMPRKYFLLFIQSAAIG